MASPPGEQVRGRYALFDELATGGMGTVHLGRLVGPVGFARIVAIKSLHPQLAKDPEFLAMFLDEARLASRVRHPNVVTMLDVVVENGTVYLVMEYVHGESLARLMRVATQRSEAVPIAVAASVLAGVLHGLHAAHEANNEDGTPLGLVHRDVSPQNVIVGADGVPRILDFGIAHAAARSHTTQDGSVKGKIAYMAPEQVRGAAADRRVDVFAAAIVAWEVLAGQRLFQGEHQWQLMEQVCRKTIPLLSSVREGVTPELDEVVMHGLARDPGERFQTARAMAVALENAVRLATPRQVGEWVESLAADSLAERAAKVTAVENSQVRLPSSDDGDRVSQVPTIVPVKTAPPDADRTELSVSTAGRSPTAAGPTRSFGPWVLVALGFAALGVSLFVRRGAVTPRSASPSAVSSVAATGTAPSNQVPAVDTEPHIDPAPSSSGPSTATAPLAGPSAKPAPKRPAPTSRPPRRDNCVPPYVVEDGVKSYKPECVH